MTRAAAIRLADVERVVRGAIRGGLPPGSFRVQVEGARITLSPIAAAAVTPEAEDLDSEIDRLLGDEG